MGPSWGPLGSLLGCHGAILEASWALLGRYWGPLGPSWAVGELKRRTCESLSNTSGKSMISALSGLPRGRLGGLLGRLRGILPPFWAVLGNLDAILARLGGILEAMGRCWGPLGASWAVGELKRRKCPNPSTTYGKTMFLPFGGPLGGTLRALRGRFGGLLGHVEAMLSLLRSILDHHGSC